MEVVSSIMEEVPEEAVTMVEVIIATIIITGAIAVVVTKTITIGEVLTTRLPTTTIIGIMVVTRVSLPPSHNSSYHSKRCQRITRSSGTMVLVTLSK